METLFSGTLACLERYLNVFLMGSIMFLFLFVVTPSNSSRMYPLRRLASMSPLVEPYIWPIIIGSNHSPIYLHLVMIGAAVWPRVGNVDTHILNCVDIDMC